tara:strand:+ start:674 stop:1288 length:615 start_codon:yes stop_codon:yes gene_type:complete
MKKTTLLIAIIAILTSCSKEEDLLPIQQQSDNPSLKTSYNYYNLTTIEEAEYKIKKSDFYQYHQNAWYLAPEDNGIITHTRYNLGELKVTNDGTGYLKSNIIPNDMIFPFRPWGSTENYDFIFTFTMTNYLINNNTIKFDLYYVSCANDTTFFTSTFDIVTTSSNNRIKLEQEYNDSYYNRNISYELENTLNGNIQLLVEKKHR